MGYEWIRVVVHSVHFTYICGCEVSTVRLRQNLVRGDFEKVFFLKIEGKGFVFSILWKNNKIEINLHWQQQESQGGPERTQYTLS
jgi:hypothetical protein